MTDTRILRLRLSIAASLLLLTAAVTAAVVSPAAASNSKAGPVKLQLQVKAAGAVQPAHADHVR